MKTKRDTRFSFFAALVAALVLIVSLTLVSCGGGGGGGSTPSQQEKILISGKISLGYTHAKPSLYAKVFSLLGFSSIAHAVADPTVDKVVAIPMERGSLSAWGMDNSLSSAISTDGQFSLSLTKDTDWLLVLINSTGTPPFVGSLAIDAGSSDSLLSFPATAANQTFLNLSSITRPPSATDDAISSYTANTADFNMTADQLTAMAKTDDIFRNAKNIINNYDTTSKVWYQLRPDFTWSGNYSQLTTGFSDPAYTFNGMGFQLDTNSSSISMDALCALTMTVELTPSVDMFDGTNTYSSSNPISNSGATGCTTVNGYRQLSGGDMYASEAYAIGSGISGGPYPRFATLPVPAATWTWKENGTTKASFDVATVNPPVNSDGTPKGFVPSFKVNLVSGTQKIESVDIKWYYYDGASYTELLQSDLSVLSHFIDNLEVKFDVTYNSTRKTCEMYFDPVTTTQVKPGDFASIQNCALTWYYDDTTHPETNTGIMGFYETGGFGYFFNFFVP